MYAGMGGDGEPMEIVSVDASVRIDDRLAVTRLDQVFRNPTPHEVEGVYDFVVPAGATLTDLVLWIGDRRVQGQVREQQDARQAYEDVVSHGVDPALVEQVGADHFRLSIFPFPAGQARRVELEYMQVLESAAGLMTYVFPLAGEKTADLHVGAFRLAARVRSQVPCTVAVEGMDPNLVSQSREGDSTEVIRCADEEVVAAGDLRLRLQESTDVPRPRLLSQPPSGSEEGYYALWLPPAAQLAQAAPTHRAVTLVLDISSSMRGSKLAAAKQALAATMGQLAPADLFNVVAFSTYAERFRPDLVPASATNIAAALDFVRLQGALGVTNFQAALQAALGVPTAAVDHRVVFLTDGRPTLGEQSLVALDALVTNLAPTARIWAIGVGEDVDRAFLEAFTEAHSGEAGFAADDAVLTERLQALLAQFTTPEVVVTRLSFTGTEVLAAVPTEIRFLRAGQEAVQVGRYTRGGDVTVGLEGRVADQPVALSWPLHLALPDSLASGSAASDSSLPMVARLWAIRTVESLENLIARWGANQELSDDILRLGLTYRLVTSRTSLYAPDPELLVNPEAGDDCWYCGASAVEDAGVRLWLGREFAQQEGVWVDLSYQPGMPRQLYRDGQGPVELAAYAALGERLLVVVEGTAWDIEAAALGPLLVGNAPNPFNASTTITCLVPPAAEAAAAELAIYDLAGQCVWRLALAAGTGQQQVRWDGTDRQARPVASGVYLCRLTLGPHTDTRRLALVR